MKILLMSIGTRGDMEPFLAAGQALSAAGHDVSYCFPAQFEALIPKNFSFYPLDAAFIEMLNSPEGRMVMGGMSGGLKSLKALYRIYKKGMKVNGKLVIDQYRIVQQVQPDRIIHHPKCNYPVIWNYVTGGQNVMLSPVPYYLHTDASHPHVGINLHLGKAINRLTYKLANTALVKTIKDSQKHLPEGKRVSGKEIRNVLLHAKLAFTISPSLYTRPGHWPNHVQVLGYHERNKAMDWRAPEELQQFLQAHKKVVLLTFGSMVSADPGRLSRICYEVLDEAGIGVLVNTSSGGLLNLPEFAKNPNFYFTDNIPYDWIMAQVYAVIHHGGSGTTHSGLKSGCPTLIIPHIMDQFIWRDLVFEKGLGPKGISAKKLTSYKLRPLVKDLLENSAYLQNAQSMEVKMQEETSASAITAFLSE